ASSRGRPADRTGSPLAAIGGSSGRCPRANSGASWLLQSTKIDFMAAPFPRRLRAYSTVSTGKHGGWDMAGEFEGKIVVISGGSRGIGRGIALAFAREGAQTVL